MSSICWRLSLPDCPHVIISAGFSQAVNDDKGQAVDHVETDDVSNPPFGERRPVKRIEVDGDHLLITWPSRSQSYVSGQNVIWLHWRRM